MIILECRRWRCSKRNLVIVSTIIIIIFILVLIGISLQILHIGEDEDEALDEYVWSLIDELYQKVSAPTVKCSKLKRVGGRATCSCDRGCALDGAKLVCFDDDVKPVPKKCRVLAFGIGFELSFDEAMSKYGCHVIALDPTNFNVTNKAYNHHLHALTIGIDNKTNFLSMDVTINNSSDSFQSQVSFLPLSYIMDILDMRETPPQILKMDIEGAEWKVFENILRTPSLLQGVTQILLEIHFDFLTNRNGEYVIDTLLSALAVFEGLQKLGYHLAFYELNETGQQILRINKKSYAVYREVVLIKRK